MNLPNIIMITSEVYRIMSKNKKKKKNNKQQTKKEKK